MGNLIEIARFYDPEEAYCASGYLRSQGIDVMIQNEHHLTMVPWLRVALGGYRLLVMSEFENDAAGILSAVSRIANDEHAAPTTRDNKTKEPPAGRAKNWLWLPIAVAWGVPFIPVRKSGWLLLVQLVALICLYATIVVGIGFWLVT